MKIFRGFWANCFLGIIVFVGGGDAWAAGRKSPGAAQVAQPYVAPKPKMPRESVQVGTFNAQFLPDAPSLRVYTGCCEDIPKRAAKLAAQVISSGYDIIAFSEVFPSDVQERLARLLRNTYPYYVQHVDGKGEHTEVDEDDVLEGGRPLSPDYCITVVSTLTGWDNCQDSGLMIFSKFPFVELPRPSKFRVDDGNLIAYSDGVEWMDVAFREFSYCTNNATDCYANKGAVLVRVQHPDSGRIYNIVATHLQTGGGLNVRVREHQFKQIQELLEQTLTADQIKNENIIVMGDFNTNGTIDESDRREWQNRFGPITWYSRNAFFYNVLRDTWEFETQDPDLVPTEKRDRGTTSSVQGPAKSQKRVDYILRNFAVNPFTNKPMCYQHITIAHNLGYGEPTSERGLGTGGSQYLSDHYGLNADINLDAPYCNSRDALAIETAHFDRRISTLTFEGDEFRITYPGSMQWFYIKDRGTYSFALYNEDGTPAREDRDHVRFRVYQSTNMSIPLVSERGETSLFLDAHKKTHEGRKYHIAEGPFYLKIFHSDPDQTGRYKLVIHKHQCITKEDACVLYPNLAEPAVYELPISAVGWTGTMWFQIDTDAPFSGAAQTLSFYVKPIPATGSPAPGAADGYDVSLFSGDGASLIERFPIGSNRIVRSNVADNDAKMYLVARPRSHATPTRFQVGWNTNLTVLHTLRSGGGNWELLLTAQRQTDQPDKVNLLFGVLDVEDDDNIRLQLYVDGDSRSIPVFHSGDRPLLAVEFDSGQSKSLEDAMPCPIGYLTDLVVEIEEEDGATRGSNDILLGFLGILGVEQEKLLRATANLIALEEPYPGHFVRNGTGRYTFNYNLSHGSHGLSRGTARNGPRGPLCDVRPSF